MKNASWTRRLMSRRPADTRRPTARPRVEVLEDRCLLAVGALDNSFDLDGRQTTALLGPGDAQEIRGIAVQPDGKTVAAGFFLFGNQAAQESFGVVRYNVNGSLDTTFGNGGRTTVSFPGTTDPRALAMGLDSTNKIVIVGWATFVADEDFIAARLNTDGSLDTTFGTNGRVVINQIQGTDSLERGSSLAFQTIGGEQRILIGGSDDFGVAPGTDVTFGVARLRNNGALDTSFNPAGPVPGTRADILGGIARAFAITTLSDNRIVMGGATNQGGGTVNNFIVIRYPVNADAAPTTRTFEFAAGATDEIRGLAVQIVGGTDRIVAAGFTGAAAAANFAIARLNADLSDDASFDTDGRQTVDFGSGDVANAVVIQTTGNQIVLAGTTGTGTANNFAIARLTTAGALDTSFDTDGRQTVDFGTGGDDRANAVALQPNLNKILVGGRFTNTAIAGSLQQFAVARLTGVDQIATAGAFDPATGLWYLRNANTAGPPFITPFAFGAPGWRPIVGDWDGDGDFTIGVYDPSTSTFYIRNTNSPGPAEFTFAFGLPGFLPVAGDWDGDGRWGFGVYDINTGNWYLRNTLNAGGPDAGSFPYGGLGLVPVVGDWNGDGTWTIGVVQSSTATWFLNDFNRAGAPTIPTFVFGTPNQKYLTGDWNGDGTWTPGLFTTAGQWLLRNTNNAGAADITFSFALGTFSPVAGDYDFPTAALHVAGGQGPGATPLSSGDLGVIVGAALTRLADAGADPGTLALLSAVRVEARDLPDDLLGYAFEDSGTLVIDADAAGHGWFIDPTPMQDEEFASGQAPGGVDLLTVVLHEMGHFAGLGDEAGSGGLMDGLLPAGVRQLGGLDALFASAGLASKRGK